MPKAVKVLWNTLTTILAVIVVGVAVLLVGVRLVGLTPYVARRGMPMTVPTEARFFSRT